MDSFFRKNVLSVLIPVYNERAFLRPLVEKVLSVQLPRGLQKELILVDDASTDGTDRIIAGLVEKYPAIRAFRQDKNSGKGAAIRRAIQEMTGEYAIIQDADLEYDPGEYPAVLKPLLEGHADVVYGSRFAAREMRRVLFYHHKLGNLALTHLSNFFTGLDLTDMETCYKAFRADVLKTIPLRSERFGMEPEITAKIAKRGCRIYEVPVNYYGRGYADGKKIGWKDGLQAVWTILKYRLIDDCYEAHYGRRHLRDFLSSRKSSLRVATELAPYLGGTITEIGAGIGNLSRRLPKCEQLVVTESDAECLEVLHSIYDDNDLVEVVALDPHSTDSVRALLQAHAASERGVRSETVVCANLLQYLPDDVTALRNLRELILPGGNLALAVPAVGAINPETGVLRRYTKDSLRQALRSAGYEVDRLWSCGFPAWALGQLGGEPGKFRLKTADMLQSIARPFERCLHLPGGCLLAVARPQ